MIASQQIAWGPANHSQALRRIDLTTQPSELAITIAQSYHNYIEKIDKPGTLSIVDLAEVEAAKTAAWELAGILESEMQTYHEAIESILSDVQHFDSDGRLDLNRDDEFVDLYHFALLVNQRINDDNVTQKARALISSLNSYVVWNRTRSGSFQDSSCGGKDECNWDLQNAYGVSVFFPSYSRSFYRDGWLDFTAGTDWSTMDLNERGRSETYDTIGWGPMLVEFVQQSNPAHPDDPNPPPLQPPLDMVSDAMLPVLLR